MICNKVFLNPGSLSEALWLCRGPVDSLRFYEDLTLDHGDVCLLFFFCGEIGRWKVNGVQLCQIQNHPEKHPNFKITKQFSSLVFSIIE